MQLTGIGRLSFRRAFITGFVLLIVAYPLIVMADWLTARIAGSSEASRQGIIELFSGSQLFEQRVLIIRAGGGSRSFGGRIHLSLFSLRRFAPLRRARHRSNDFRALVRCGACASSVLCAAFCSRGLFHACLRVERFAPGLDDDAFYL